MPDQSPVLDVLACTYGEALGIYLYAHRQIDDPRDVGQAEIVRGKENSSSASADTASIAYITRGANSERRYWEIAAEPVEFAFDLQQTLARYAAGLVDAEIAVFQQQRAAAEEADRQAFAAGVAHAAEGVGDTWSASPGQDDEVVTSWPTANSHTDPHNGDRRALPPVDALNECLSIYNEHLWSAATQRPADALAEVMGHVDRMMREHASH